MTSAWMLAVFVALAPAPTPQGAGAGAVARPIAPQQTPDASAPVIDIALRQIRADSGGSSIARSAARGADPAFVYAGLGPCVVGASAADPARLNSSTWRASGRVVTVTSNMAHAEVEWQRIDYRPAGISAGPRVRMTLALPLGERIAVDFLDMPGSPCRMNALIFEIGVAIDHGTRLSMSSEGRPPIVAGGRAGGGGAGRPLAADEGAFDPGRQRQGEEAARAAPTVTRPMPPREYQVDLWLLREAADSPASSKLAQKLSKAIGGTGGRFEFPPDTGAAGSEPAIAVDVSALVIPVDGDRLVVAITRRTTPADGNAPVSAGWVKAIAMPKAEAILSFEIPAYPLRLQVVRR